MNNLKRDERLPRLSGGRFHESNKRNLAPRFSTYFELKRFSFTINCNRVTMLCILALVQRKRSAYTCSDASMRSHRRQILCNFVHPKMGKIREKNSSWKNEVNRCSVIGQLQHENEFFPLTARTKSHVSHLPSIANKEILYFEWINLNNIVNVKRNHRERIHVNVVNT